MPNILESFDNLLKSFKDISAENQFDLNLEILMFLIPELETS